MPVSKNQFGRVVKSRIRFAYRACWADIEQYFTETEQLLIAEAVRDYQNESFSVLVQCVPLHAGVDLYGLRALRIRGLCLGFFKIITIDYKVIAF